MNKVSYFAVLLALAAGGCFAEQDAVLPAGVKAVWDMDKAYHETTPTREQICINGLWRWQPVTPGAAQKEDTVPPDRWGYFKVPGPWNGVVNMYLKESQNVYAPPAWQAAKLADVTAAWYQREIAIPPQWAGRRISLSAEYINSVADVFVDGKSAGTLRFPAGVLDLTALCRPGAKHVLSMLVRAVPRKAFTLAHNDTIGARRVETKVARRGLCGDVYLNATPPGARITDIKVETAVRRWEISFNTALESLDAAAQYTLQARILDGEREVQTFASKPFTAAEVKAGRFTFTAPWKPEKLWDLHTPQNTYHVSLTLWAGNKTLDAFLPVRFGFRECWIEGRDIYLNGSRVFFSCVPLMNAVLGAAWADYAGAKESLERLKQMGVNFVFTDNFGCEPGDSLSLEQILRAADDLGVCISVSQPHSDNYDWKAKDAALNNGYASHAEFLVRAAQNHPCVIAYAMNHNGFAYPEDINPDLIDGIHSKRVWGQDSLAKGLEAQAIVKQLDPTRFVYHHGCGLAGDLHTPNFYANFAPIQEMSDWFEHWATTGVKPFFPTEYATPLSLDWTMYRGWSNGRREYGGAVVGWEYCVAEWVAQFFGDRAFMLSDLEKSNLRFEDHMYRAGKTGWKRWEYPHENMNSGNFEARQPVYAMYATDNWRAFRTWGLPVTTPWEYSILWKLRDGLQETNRRDLSVDWDNLQRPGYSPDFKAALACNEFMSTGYERADWIPTAGAQALLRNNQPLLAYIGGKPAHFTSKDHNFVPGETVEKQVIIVNNSRQTAACDCTWSLGLPTPIPGHQKISVETGKIANVPLSFALPANLAPGAYELNLRVQFDKAEPQTDTFTLHVLMPLAPVEVAGKVALFDPKGETAALLKVCGVQAQSVGADANLKGYDILLVGKGALTVDGPAPDISGVRDGLKVVLFEQTTEVYEKRLGLRALEYGLRQVFRRVPDHPALAGLDDGHLRDWRGEATILPPRLTYVNSARFNFAPTIKWCDVEVPQIWRCGCRGNVASVLIEKPAKGDFLPLIDGGYSLQFSPLMEYREGKGLVLFCQLDVTGRTEADPAAQTVACNLLKYVSDWRPSPRRQALYAGDPEGKRHLEFSGISVLPYEGGKLSNDQVLVLSAGAEAKLGAGAQAVAAFVKGGGNVLALGLSAPEARACLGVQVGMKAAEHIGAYFAPPGLHSLFAGVGPADVHNRVPRELPLITDGATVLGDGVLAQALNSNVVFCQHLPYQVSRAQGQAPSLVVNGSELVEGKPSALVNLSGLAGTALLRQSIKGDGIHTGQNYTCAILVKPLGVGLTAHLEVERHGSPWDRALTGADTQLKANEWSELHETFKVALAYPEGWTVMFSCAQAGAQFRLALFRLYAGNYVPAKTPAPAPNLLANPNFETGMQGWTFEAGEQRDQRRTYRRASFQLARLLANMGVAAPTPLLARLSNPVTAAKPEKRWADGFYLDQPEEWDDPYRFFGW